VAFDGLERALIRPKKSTERVFHAGIVTSGPHDGFLEEKVDELSRVSVLCAVCLQQVRFQVYL
jgi:hypothetical protein